MKSAIVSKKTRLYSAQIIAAVLGVVCWMPADAAETSPTPKPVLPPKRIVVPRLRDEVKIDGELDEPVWAQAALIQPFVQNDGSGAERQPTELRLWYDNVALYLGWRCQDSDIQPTMTNRDSNLYLEEVVECFLAPKNPTHYYEFEWNARGAIFDAIIDARLDDKGIMRHVSGDRKYTAKGMKSAVKVKGRMNKSSEKDEFWQVEIRLPFADLGQPTPKPREVWHANFYRINRTRGEPVEHLSWSPTLSPSFHQPSRFGLLEFGE